MNKAASLTGLLMLTACSLAPDFKLPEMKLPTEFREESTQVVVPAAEEKGVWKPAKTLGAEERGKWWLVFDDAQLNDLEQKAQTANPTLKAAAARVEESRSIAGANTPSLLPNIDINGNAVRAKTSGASLVAFGAPPGTQTKPYTLYSAQGVASYEADLFGRVRDNYKAFSFDADAQDANYKNALLALQADVAEQYFTLRALDAERNLLRDTVKIREEAARIIQRRFEVGDIQELDHSRAQSDLASIRAELIALDRQRVIAEHALAILLGEMPSNFAFAEMPLDGLPPEIPAGLPSDLLQRRPDITAAQAMMAAANARIGVARTAFFPSLILTATGGLQSADLSDLFKWSSRSWALGQTAGAALAMPIFDSGRNLSRLDAAHASYDEAVANYQSQVLVAFRDVENNLASQGMLADQSREQDTAAAAAAKTTSLSQKRYDQGEADYFEIVETQRTALAIQRAAVQTRGQRFITTVELIRALGGGWESAATIPPVVPQPIADVPAPPLPTPQLETK